MSKISVKHYLNKKLKPFHNGIENTFPVYIRILIDREVLRIKSPLINGDKWFSYFDEKQFSNDEDLQKTISNEIKLIKFVLKNTDEFKNLDLSDVVRNLNANICNQILNWELNLTYFQSFSINEPNFFNVLKYYLSIYLSKKSNIESAYFFRNIDVENTSDYKYLNEKDFIANVEIKQIFEIVIKLREFEKLEYTTTNKSFTPYTTEKPLNIYEWLFNGGKEKFIAFLNSTASKNIFFENLINSINNYCLMI